MLSKRTLRYVRKPAVWSSTATSRYVSALASSTSSQQLGASPSRALPVVPPIKSLSSTSTLLSSNSTSSTSLSPLTPLSSLATTALFSPATSALPVRPLSVSQAHESGRATSPIASTVSSSVSPPFVQSAVPSAPKATPQSYGSLPRFSVPLRLTPAHAALLCRAALRYHARYAAQYATYMRAHGQSAAAFATNTKTQSTTSSSSSSSSSSGGKDGATPPPPPTPPKSFLRKLGMILASVLGLGVVGYAALYVEHMLQPDPELFVMPVIPPPEQDFNHPLNETSVVYKAYFTVKRYLFLIGLFFPLIIYHFWTSWKGTPEARQAFLDYLVLKLETAGCSFLKFGQWLSMRPDMFPPDVIRALSKLRDNAPSHSYAETRAVVKEQFGHELEEIFATFDPEPVASGSIAQVYRAKLTPEWRDKVGLVNQYGEVVDEVAVKVRHPRVLEDTWMDVDIIFAFVNNSKMMTVPFSKEEFLRLMQKQIDFRWEGHYLSRFAHNFKEETRDGRMRFPAVSTELLAQGVLVEAWAEGQSVAKIFTEVGEGFTTTGTVDPEAVARATAGNLGASSATATAGGGTSGKGGLDLTPAGMVAHWGRQLTRWAKQEYQHVTSTLVKFHRSHFGPRRRQTYGDEDIDDDALIAKYTNNPALLQAMSSDGVFDVVLIRKKQELAYTMFDMFLKMFLRDNLIHGDLHAGNVLYSAGDNAVTILDAGMTVTLDPEVMPSFGKFLHAICSGNADALVERIQTFEINRPHLPAGSGRGHLATNPALKAQFSRDMHEITDRFFKHSSVLGVNIGNRRPENVSVGDVVGQVLFCMQRHNIVLRGDVAASIMAMSVCEGLIRQLDPTLDIVLKSLPYFVKYKGFATVAQIM